MIVKIKNIFKYFNSSVAINGVSLDIKHGERLVILGPSGCGKTTLLRMIAGFSVPDKGSISIDGQLVAKDGKSVVEPEKRQIGMVFQDLALWPHMNVYKNLEFGLIAQKIPRKKRAERIEQILEKVQLSNFITSLPCTLSGGQQQRVALARAIVMRPKILLMDEPLSSLDYDLNALLRKEILKLQEETNITMLYVTHDRTEAFDLATRIIVMRHGKIHKIGSVNQISEFFSE